MFLVYGRVLAANVCLYTAPGRKRFAYKTRNSARSVRGVTRIQSLKLY